MYVSLSSALPLIVSQSREQVLIMPGRQQGTLLTILDWSFRILSPCSPCHSPSFTPKVTRSASSEAKRRIHAVCKTRSMHDPLFRPFPSVLPPFGTTLCWIHHIFPIVTVFMYTLHVFRPWEGCPAWKPLWSPCPPAPSLYVVVTKQLILLLHLLIDTFLMT